MELTHVGAEEPLRQQTLVCDIGCERLTRFSVYESYDLASPDHRLCVLCVTDSPPVADYLPACIREQGQEGFISWSLW